MEWSRTHLGRGFSDSHQSCWKDKIMQTNLPCIKSKFIVWLMLLLRASVKKKNSACHEYEILVDWYSIVLTNFLQCHLQPPKGFPHRTEGKWRCRKLLEIMQSGERNSLNRLAGLLRFLSSETNWSLMNVSILPLFTDEMKALFWQCTLITTLCLAAQCIASSYDNSKYLQVSKQVNNS